MASNVETGAPADVSVSVRREGRPRVGQGLTTFGLLGPTVIALAIFFLAPLWYIFEFSTGLKYFAPKPALAGPERRADGLQRRRSGRSSSARASS